MEAHIEKIRVTNDIATLFKMPDPAPLTATAYQAPKQIRIAIRDVIKAISAIEKRGSNKKDGYTFARADDIVGAVSAACEAAGIIITQHTLGVWQDPSKNMVVAFQFVIQSVETDDIWLYPGPWLGVADDWDDSGGVANAMLNDKWFNMALTAAQKYFYVKLFKIETKESVAQADPDAGSDRGSQPRTAVPRGSKETEDLRNSYRHIVSQIDGARNEVELQEVTESKEYGELAGYSKNTKEDLARRVAKQSESFKGD